MLEKRGCLQNYDFIRQSTVKLFFLLKQLFCFKLQMKLQGDKDGRKGRLSVATEVCLQEMISATNLSVVV